MTLKYKLVTEPTGRVRNNEDVKFHLDTIRQLRMMPKGLKETEELPSVQDITTRIRKAVKQHRANLKEALNPILKEQFLKVVADKEWDMYPEYVSDETGKTCYGASDGSGYIQEEYTYKGEKAIRTRFSGLPEKYKVDAVVPYEVSQLDMQDEDGNPLNTQIKGNMLAKIKVLRAEALGHLQRYRKKRQEIEPVIRTYNPKTDVALPFKLEYKVYPTPGLGGAPSSFIHMEKGEIMKLNASSRLRKVFQSKKPMSELNHVGVEIEFLCKLDKRELGEILVEANLQDFVYLQGDGSLRADTKYKDYKYESELCVIAPENQIQEILKGVIACLDKAGSMVNKTCGLHVHLDMRKRDKKIAFFNLVKAQNILYAMNPASRLSGQDEKGQTQMVYSKKVTTLDFDEAAGTVSGNRTDRYQGINALSFKKHSTIEVRIHSGSTNFEKISNWVKILVAIVNSTEKNTTEYVKPEAFVERYNLGDDVLQYINSRINKFKDKAGKHITVEEVA